MLAALLFFGLSDVENKPIIKAYNEKKPCKICKDIYKFSHSPKNANITKDKMQTMYLNKCTKLPNATRGFCTILVQDFFEKIATSDKKKEACTFVCQAKNITKPAHPIKPFKHGKNITKEQVMKKFGKLIPKSQFGKKGPRPSITGDRPKALGLLPCDACSTIVDVSMELAPEFIGTFDINFFQEACKQIPMFADRCDLLTDEVFAKTATYILSNLSSYELCVQYGCC